MSTASSIELAYPIPTDEDTVDPTEPMICSQTTATIIANNLEVINKTLKSTVLSNASVTATKAPHVETTVADVNLSMSSDLASPKHVQTPQNITILGDKNDKPAGIRDARLLNEISGEFLFFPFSSSTAQLCRTGNNSKNSFNELI